LAITGQRQKEEKKRCTTGGEQPQTKKSRHKKKRRKKKKIRWGECETVIQRIRKRSTNSLEKEEGKV